MRGGGATAAVHAALARLSATGASDPNGVHVLFSKEEDRFVPVVRAAPQLDVCLVVAATRREGTNMMKF